MPQYNKTFLSQSSFGKSIPVTQTGVSGTLIHQTQTITGAIDEVWMYASNATSYPILLTVRYGNSGISGDAMNFNIDSYAGNTLLIPGLILAGDGSNPANIYASIPSGSVSGINIFGYINRIQ